MTTPFFSSLHDRKWHEGVAVFHSVGLPGLAVALALSLVNYALRFVRWQEYLSPLGHTLPHKPGAIIDFAGADHAGTARSAQWGEQETTTASW